MLCAVGRRLTQLSPIVKEMRTLYERAGRPSYSSLGRLANIADKTVKNYLEGDTDRPDEEKVAAIIKGIRTVSEATSEANVIELKDHQSRRIATGFAITIAVRSWRGVLAAGDDYEDCYLEEDGMSEIPTAFLVGGMQNAELHGVVRVAGNSMSPRIESGERVIVYLDPTPIPNAIMMVQSPDGKVMLKVVRNNGGMAWSFESIHRDGLKNDAPKGWSFKGVAVAVMGHPDSGRNIEWTGRPLRA